MILVLMHKCCSLLLARQVEYIRMYSHNSNFSNSLFFIKALIFAAKETRVENLKIIADYPIQVE